MRFGLAGWDAHWAEEFQKHAEPEQVPARVFSRNRHIYSVYTEAGEVSAELTGALFARATPAELPAVGDWVVLRQMDETSGAAIIESVLPRRTKFSRKTAGSATREQIIAANI